MNSYNYMLNKFLPRVDFSSYEDFKHNYKLNIPDGFNFAYDVVDEWAKAFPDKRALIHYDDQTEKSVDYTFGDMSRMSNKAACAFTRLGIKKGDKVMLILRQRVEVWVSFLALHKIGAVCIPATFQLTPKDIVYRCESAGIKMICTVDQPDILENIKQALGDCKTLEKVCVVGENIPEGMYNLRAECENSSDTFERIPNHINDPMLMYFSSGTTGMPKMILHDFTYPLGHIVTAKYWQRIQDNGVHLTMADSGWAKFGWGKIYGQWICGTAIVAYDDKKFVPANLMKAIANLKLTTFCAPPTIFRFLIKEDLSKGDFSSIKHCTTAGEPLNAEVFNKFYQATGLKITEGFGQTEGSVLIANFEWFDICPGSTGKPSPLYDIDIVDENGVSCEDGVVGSIVIKNASSQHPAGLFREYVNDPDTMNKVWVNGVYNTGDVAWRDAQGYFHFEGRNDDVIKCSGYRIGPFEVESALLTHPAVLECAITAAPDPVRGQVVKATIVLARGFTPSDELIKELQNHVKKVTAPYKYPRIVEFVDELPKTIGGKIKRKEIRLKDQK